MLIAAGAAVYSIYEYSYVDKEKGTQDLTKVALSTVGSLGALGSTGSMNAGGTSGIEMQGDVSAALSGGKLIGYTLSLDAAVASDPAVSAALGITQATIANGGGFSGEQSEDKEQKYKDLLSSEEYKEFEGYDCSEIANDFYKVSDGKGNILRIEGKEGIIQSYEYGYKETFDYHEVFTDGKYIYDPRYKDVPVLKDDYFNILKEINPQGFDVFTKK